MKKWYDDWGVWLISVCALIGFGVLIGHDLTDYESASTAISAIGTLMLGVAALIAVPYWRLQEKKKFQASYAASMHAQLSEFREGVYRINEHCKGKALIDSELQDFVEPITKTPIVESKQSIHDLLCKMHAILESFILPRSLMLGTGFAARCRNLRHAFETLLHINSKERLDSKCLDELIVELDDMLIFLSEIALFKR